MQSTDPQSEEARSELELLGLEDGRVGITLTVPSPSAAVTARFDSDTAVPSAAEIEAMSPNAMQAALLGARFAPPMEVGSFEIARSPVEPRLCRIHHVEDEPISVLGISAEGTGLGGTFLDPEEPSTGFIDLRAAAAGAIHSPSGERWRIDPTGDPARPSLELKQYEPLPSEDDNLRGPSTPLVLDRPLFLQRPATFNAQPGWLTDVISRHLEGESAWTDAAAVGIFVRLREVTGDEARAALEVLRRGGTPERSRELEQWIGEQIDDTVAQAILREAIAAQTGIEEELHALAETLDFDRTEWVERLRSALHYRDDVEGVLAVLRRTGHSDDVRGAFEVHDRVGRDFVIACPSVERLTTDERLVRILVVDPAAWWAAPASSER